MTLAAGSRLGSYEIVAPIGAGGMGEVYRARDTKLGREIAIKVLPDETASDPGRRQRFEQEARSASALNHPNILTIYDIGTTDGTVYIAMELVEGKTLRELVASGEPLPTRRLLDVAVQTAEGLAKAHAAGIVHRDLKPENLMVSRDGFVKILDFGLAKLTEAAPQEASVLPTAVASPTQPGTVMGTAGYMSPEQASGQSVDFRSDQFTLGSIVYEMATGKRAFQRKTGAETLVAIIKEEPQPLSQAAPRAPAPVRWIVERCLSKDPEERYASTKDLARDLKSVRDHLTETSASGAIETVPAKVRRRGWLFPAALCLVLGAGLASFAAWKFQLYAPAPPRFQKLTFRRGTILNARFAPDGNSVIYGAAVEGSPVEIFTTRPESPESKSLGFPSANVLAVSKTGELAISLGQRLLVGWETVGTLARVPMSGGAPRELLESVQDADWSPDGSSLAVSHRVADRVRLEYPIGTVLHEATGWLSHPRFSPDGRYIAFFDHPERGDSAGRLVILDLKKKSKVLGPIFGGNSGIAWSSRGDVVLNRFGGLVGVSPSGSIHEILGFAASLLPQDLTADGRLLAKGTNSRREIVGTSPGDSRERNLTWLDWSYPDDISEDGRTLLFDEQQRGRANYLCYARKTDGSPAVLLGTARGFALSSDGRWALTINPDASQLTLLPTGPGSPRVIPKSGLIYQWGSFLPDGKRLLLTASEPGRGARIYVQDLDGGKPRAITPEGYTIPQKAVSPDGRTVAAIGPDRKIQLCSTSGAEPPRPLPGAREDEHAFGWTGDGKSVYLGLITNPARIDLCDVSTGERRLWKEIVPPDPAGVLSIGPILITPDGKSYVYSYRRLLDELVLLTGLK